MGSGMICRGGALPLCISRPDHRRAARLLHLDPVPRRPRPIGCGEPLRHDALKAILQDWWKSVGPLVTATTFAYLDIGDDLPNGRHLEVNDAIELRAGDTQVASSCADTTLSASEGHFAHINGQLGNLQADALCHRPAMSCHLFGIVRHPRAPALPGSWLVLGRVGQAIGSLSYFAVCLR
jgi:hypothetical protein